MVPRLLRQLAGVLLLALGLCALLASTTTAQDRSLPRFGPVVTPDTVQAGSFDLGRLWSVAEPPIDYVQNTYDVPADERGLRHLRLGTVRLPDCSGTIVSPRGLVLTAARCVRPFLPAGDGDSLRSEAFVAGGPEEERALSGLYAERVVGVEAVTAQAERDGRDAVQKRLQDEAGMSERVKVVPEAGGVRYVAYTYRRYEDVRLAFYPDRAVTLAGRQAEPLTYPQHTWDVAVLRVYSAEDPVRTPEHLSVRASGARPGDAVFAVGHPAETRRAETHDQLTLRRDLQLPAQVSAVETWIEVLRQYGDTTAQAGGCSNRLMDARDTRHQLRARLDALQNDYVMDRLRARDRALEQTLSADTAREKGTFFNRMTAVQNEKRAHAAAYRAFTFLLHPKYSSATLRRAVRVAQAEADGEYSSSVLQEALGAVSDQPPALDAALMAAHVEGLRQHLPSDSALTGTLPTTDSTSALVEASIFSDVERLRKRVRENDLPEDDPVLHFARVVADRYDEFHSDWTVLTERESRLTDSLARIRHRAADRPVALPQARALRMADGRIQGYPYNGTIAPPFTTFYGLYGRHQSVQSAGAALPSRWQSPAASFERSTPLATVASTDLGGGAYGGPLVNTSLELVGVVFDGNVQSAAGEYLFMPDRMRAVSVDVRGVLEGLSAVYEADHLVQEMTKESMAP